MARVSRKITINKKKLVNGGPINDPTNGAFGQTDPNAPPKKPDVAGNTASSVGKAVPLWGTLFGIGETVSNQTKAQSTDFMHQQAGRVQDPFGWAKGNKNAADWGKSILDPSGLMDAFNGKTARAQRAAKAAKDSVTNAQNTASGTAFYNTQNAQLSKPAYQGGGQLPSGDKVLKGGKAKPVAPGVSEIISNKPSGTDNVETEGAMLDHKEIVDSKNRVFSNTLRLPSGETVAQKAKKIAGNGSQLNRLFQFQENNKPAMKKVSLPFSNKRNMNAGQPYTGNVPRKPQFAMGGEILPRTSKDPKQDQPRTPAGKMISHPHSAAKKIPIRGGNTSTNDRPGPRMTSSTIHRAKKKFKLGGQMDEDSSPSDADDRGPGPTGNITSKQVPIPKSRMGIPIRNNRKGLVDELSSQNLNRKGPIQAIRRDGKPKSASVVIKRQKPVMSHADSVQENAARALVGYR